MSSRYLRPNSMQIHDLHGWYGGRTSTIYDALRRNGWQFSQQSVETVLNLCVFGSHRSWGSGYMKEILRESLLPDLRRKIASFRLYCTTSTTGGAAASEITPERPVTVTV